MEEIIRIETTAYRSLLEKTLALMKDLSRQQDDKYVTPDRAKEILGCTSDNYLRSLRDSGAIEFSSASKKIIMYNKASLVAYLDKHSKKTF